MKIQIVLMTISLSSALATGSSADVLFESSTLGPTGITWTQLTDQSVPGTNVKDTVFVGARFQLSEPVVTSEIGGHFVGPISGSFFGAIVELTSESDFPDSNDLTTPDVLATTLLSFPTTSNEVFGNLELALDPGWYALVFGSGRFQATEQGAAVRNGTDIGTPAYIVSFPAGTGWHNVSSSLPNHRFILNGQIVPEPCSIYLASISMFGLMFRRTR